jgi:tetratricopeptide (TPR) repeat protein
MRLTMDQMASAPGIGTRSLPFARGLHRGGKWALLLSCLIGGPALIGRAQTPSRQPGEPLVFAALTDPPAAPAHGHHSGNPAANAPAAVLAADQLIVDDAYRSSAKDLQLNLDGERKADAAARFMHGLMLEESSDADQALDEYLKALALDPANVDLSIKLAWEYLRRDDTPAAINLLKDTIKAAPKEAEAPLALAYLYFNTLNKSDLAQKYAAQALEIDPNNIYCYQYLKEIYKASGQTQKIAPLLDRAAKAESKDPAYWLQLGLLYIDALLKGPAFAPPDVSTLTAHAAPPKPSDELKKTDAVFQKALTFGNDDPDVVEKVADFYVATQQLPDAIPLYKRVIEMDITRNGARENLARAYLGTGQKDLATATLEELIKADPVQHHAYEFLAKLYEDAGKIDKAIANYEQSLLITPNHPEAYEGLALLLIDHKQPEKAVAVLTEARKRFSDQPWFAFLLAVALSETKQLQAALGMFEETVVEAQNVQPGMLNAQFYLQYGETAEQAGLYDQAAQWLKKSLETEEDPERIAVTSNYLGYMWVDHSINIEEGGALIKRALEIEPDNGAYLDSMGWYYYRTSQFDKALPELTRAVDLTKPEDPTVYEHLGDTYFKCNEVAKAVNCWQKAVELDPANPNIPELNKKIAETKAPPAAASPAPAPGTPSPSAPAPKS